MPRNKCMINNQENKYDIIVIGAGHAGAEAALAGARMGKEVLCLTVNLDGIAMMACNPAVGGTSKGHLVREVDALGGEMGRNIDATAIQTRMLNLSKGPAVHSLRAQADKTAYHIRMKSVMENTPRLHIKQEEAVALLVEEQTVRGVRTQLGFTYMADTVILCTGVYLKSRIIIGEFSQEAGPSGLFGANQLTQSLLEHGIEIARFKTGTPARVDARTIDFDKMEIQDGDHDVYSFSFEDSEDVRPQIPCYLTWTNERTHQIIRDNLNRSPLYSGNIEGTGPRYCPSIEDKVVRFADKSRHQVFIEPEGLNTREMYVQGMSTSLPYDVQIAFLRTIEGLENVEIMRPGYAIEYDCIVPTQLDASLMFKEIQGLFAAGQINGSSGYEEAAAQGLLAGINAVHYLDQKAPLILTRSDAYIGVLIDDLVTKGTEEPYRMMTSRAEHRLLLRQDNADLRLTAMGYQAGLAGEDRYQRMLEKGRQVEEIKKAMEGTFYSPSQVRVIFEEAGETMPTNSIQLTDALKRVNITIDQMIHHGFLEPIYSEDALRQAQIQIKYSGYIARQRSQVKKQRRMESHSLEDIDFLQLKGLRKEAAQKLQDVRPKDVGQASRISGVSPADIGVLLVYLEREKRRR